MRALKQAPEEECLCGVTEREEEEGEEESREGGGMGLCIDIQSRFIFLLNRVSPQQSRSTGKERGEREGERERREGVRERERRGD